MQVCFKSTNRIRKQEVALRGSGEGYNEKPILLIEYGCIKAMVEHGVAHAGESRSALLHLIEHAKRLGNEGIAGTRTIIPLAELCQCKGFKQIAGAGNYDAQRH